MLLKYETLGPMTPPISDMLPSIRLDFFHLLAPLNVKDAGVAMALFSPNGTLRGLLEFSEMRSHVEYTESKLNDPVQNDL